MLGYKMSYIRTLLVSVEENALGFEDKDDVFRVRTVYESCRFSAQKLICFVHLFKCVLYAQICACTVMNTEDVFSTATIWLDLYY